MAYQTLKFRITGVAPLLMHNCQLANPLNKFTKAIKVITAKKNKKTDADMEELARLEFLGGLYAGPNGEPVIPGENIEGMIRDGAKKTRKGKDVQCGVISDGLWPLIYDGPVTADALWEDERFRDIRPVAVQKARVMRMRPKFLEWSLEFDVSFEPEIMNARDVQAFIETAGQYCGLMDGRPRFGRFIVDSAK